MAHQRKHVMPLRLSTKLRSTTCIHDRLVKKMFKVTPQCRLDHSDQVTINQSSLPLCSKNGVPFDLTPELKEFNGHYYLIVLNLKAERFEVMDSLRGKRSKGLLEDSRAIIESIKHLWEMNYGDSKINIQNWRTEHIDTPMQKTSYDCSFFMLKFIELWNGRMMGPFNPTDMPNIRKFFLKKWLEFEENKTIWQEYLF